jgi:hypothetical protein
MGKYEIVETYLELAYGVLTKADDPLLAYLIEMAILENGRRMGLTAAEPAFEPRTPERSPEPHGSH